MHGKIFIHRRRPRCSLSHHGVQKVIRSNQHPCLSTTEIKSGRPFGSACLLISRALCKKSKFSASPGLVEPPRVTQMLSRRLRSIPQARPSVSPQNPALGRWIPIRNAMSSKCGVHLPSILQVPMSPPQAPPPAPGLQGTAQVSELRTPTIQSAFHLIESILRSHNDQLSTGTPAGDSSMHIDFLASTPNGSGAKSVGVRCVKSDFSALQSEPPSFRPARNVFSGTN